MKKSKDKSYVFVSIVFLGYNEQIKRFLGDFFARLIEVYLDPSQSIDAGRFFKENSSIIDELESFRDFNRENLPKKLEALEAELLASNPKIKGLSFFADLHLCNMINILDSEYYQKLASGSGKEYNSVSLKSLNYIGNNDSNPLKDDSYHYHLSKV